jgi:hypothetical protein
MARDALPRVRRCTSKEREKRGNLGQRVAGRNQPKGFSRRSTTDARERIPTAPLATSYCINTAIDLGFTTYFDPMT